MANINSYKNLLSVLEDIARRHYNINTYFVGQDHELGQSNPITYPCLQVYPMDATMNKQGEYGTLDLRLNCKILDLLRTDLSNLSDIHSDSLRIATDLTKQLNQHPFYHNSGLQVVGDISCSFFEEETGDNAAGVSFEMLFRIINTQSFCGLPMSDIQGYSFTGPESTGYTQAVNYLTCGTVTACTTLTNYINQLISTGDTNDITRIQGGTNTYTGGTANAPTVNVSALTINTLTTSGQVTHNSFVQFGANVNAAVTNWLIQSSNGGSSLGLNTRNDAPNSQYNIFHINKFGYVGIGTTTPTDILTVTGNTYIGGNLTANTLSATTGLGIGAVPTSNNLINILKGQNAETKIYVQNTTLGAGSAAGVQFLNNNNDAKILQTSTSNTNYTPNALNFIQATNGGFDFKNNFRSLLRITDSGTTVESLTATSGNIVISSTTTNKYFEAIGTIGQGARMQADSQGAWFGSSTNVPTRILVNNGVYSPIVLNTSGEIILSGNTSLSSNTTTGFTVTGPTIIPAFVVDTNASRVGIGGIYPAMSLDVTGKSTTDIVARFLGDSSRGASIKLTRAASYEWSLGCGGSTGIIPASSFGIYDNSPALTRLLIAHTTGYVGLNNTSPIERLDVSGNTYVRGGITGTSATISGNTRVADGILFVSRLTDSNVSMFSINVGTSNVNAFQLNVDQPNAKTNLTSRNNYSLNLQTNDTDRILITSGGSVGISTASPLAKLHISGTTGDLFMITNSSGNNAFRIDNSGLKAQFYGGGGINYPSITSTASVLNGIGQSSSSVALVIGSSARLQVSGASGILLNGTQNVGGGVNVYFTGATQVDTLTASTIAITGSTIAFTSSSSNVTISNAGNLRLSTGAGADVIFDTGGGSAILRVSNNATTYSNGTNITFSTGSTGTKIGTASSQKLGLWNATPIVQPTTATTSSTLVSNGGTTITDTDTFDGYTLTQIVKALRDIGALA